MYKVLLADDEAIICRGIEGCIDWQALNMKVVATASDGAEALEKIQTFQPDLCLLDVRMPFVDGLEVAAAYLAENPDGIVIMVSGYDEFHYAQKALNTGVFGYILKPVDEDELLLVVQKAAAALANRQQTQQADALLKNNRQALRNVFLQKLLAEPLSHEEMQSNLGLHSISLPPSPTLLVLRFYRDTGNRFLSQEHLSATMAELRQYLVKTTEPFAPRFVITVDEQTLAVVHNADAQSLWVSLAVEIYRMTEERGLQVLLFHQQLEHISQISSVFAQSLAEFGALNQLSPITNLLKQYVEQSYTNPAIRLQAFAEAHHTTSSYLSRLFKQEFGQSFVDYLTSWRILKSAYYLQNPHLKICEIAEQVGYSSQHYYCESFKRITGMSPTDYRKQATAPSLPNG